MAFIKKRYAFLNIFQIFSKYLRDAGRTYIPDGDLCSPVKRLYDEQRNREAFAR